MTVASRWRSSRPSVVRGHGLPGSPESPLLLIPAGGVLLPAAPSDRAQGLEQLEWLGSPAQLIAWAPDPALSPNARRQLEDQLSPIATSELAERIAASGSDHPSAMEISDAFAKGSVASTSVRLARLAGLPAGITPEIGLAAVATLIALAEGPESLLGSVA